jgi:hypothetical protein
LTPKSHANAGKPRISAIAVPQHLANRGKGWIFSGAETERAAGDYPAARFNQA